MSTSDKNLLLDVIRGKIREMRRLIDKEISNQKDYNEDFMQHLLGRDTAYREILILAERILKGE